MVTQKNRCELIPHVEIDYVKKRVLSKYPFRAVVLTDPNRTISGSLDCYFRKEYGDRYVEFDSNFKEERDDALIKSLGLNPDKSYIIRGTVILEEQNQ